MKLVLAEKPSVGIAIAKVLKASNKKDGYYEGSGYYVSWCVGHLVELATAEYYDKKYEKWNYNDLPILPTNWKYNISKGKEKQMRIISTLMNKVDVDTIVCATDAGREGELIFRLVYNKIGCIKPVKRLWISSLEDEAISNGFSNLHDGKNFDNLYQAALCRSQADWIVGMNATRLFTVLYGQTLNIGRVLSPTLAMIVERNASIEAFTSEPFYNVVLDLGDFVVTSNRLKYKTEAEKIANFCNGNDVVITKVECKEKTEKPPKLYDLTTLQREANKHLGFTAEQTLQYTQSLYEQKLVTYPRTDSRYLTTDMRNSVPNIIDECLNFYVDKDDFTVNIEQVIDNNKVSDHHAIIPTIKIKNFDYNATIYGEREILKLITRRLAVATNENHIYSETIVTAKCGDYEFTASGKTVIKNGFKNIEKISKNEETKEKSLPQITEGEYFKAKSFIKNGKTSPPKNFTDDTLLSAMENANNAEVDADMKGIGTPATRASIIEKIVKIGFAERRGEKKTKYFVPTEKGISLVTVLPQDLVSPYLTAEWEEKLKKIENGTLSANEFLEEISETTSNLVKTYQVPQGADVLFPKKSTQDSVGTCPRCGSEVAENAKGFCCSSKNCSFAIWKDNKFFTAKKKAVTNELVSELLSTGKAELKYCYSAKTGKKYNCTVLLDDTGEKYVNFKLEFFK
ncbi:MAG: DNA topoisomerase 3 [Clostridia bacterium]